MNGEYFEKGIFIKPNFERSVVNISATLAAFLGCPNRNPIIPSLASALKGGYKNVVLLILDGMGMHPLRKNKQRFFLDHVSEVLTSVFPSTTTNATTSLRTDLTPMEHGWFGWSLYFEELNRAVDIFEDVDSYTGEPVERGYAKRMLPAPPFYRTARSEYTVNVVVPSFWEEEKNRYVWETPSELFPRIEEVCKKGGKQFVYAYCTEPDSTMHRYGVSSEETARVLDFLAREAERTCASLKDTLFIITADHGQVDVGGSFDLYEDRELLSLLSYPPYLEARASAFKVREGMQKKFTEYFRERYGEDFVLFPVREMIEEGFFGEKTGGHGKLLGDFIAVGATDKIMRLTPRSHFFKGHHTSLTQEMLVPLILLG